MTELETITEELELKTITEKLSYIQRRLSVKKSQTNTFGNYQYRTAEDIYTCFKEIINKHNIDVFLITNFKTFTINNKIFLECEAIIKDEDSEIKANGFAELASEKKGMDIAQLTGSTQTYARKYALQSLLAIDDKEMDLDSEKIKEKEQKALKQEKNNLINQLQGFLDENIVGQDGEIITKEKILNTYKKDKLNSIHIDNLKEIIKRLVEYKVQQKNNKENENI